MGILYDENPLPRKGGFVNYYNINACKGFLTHTYNLLYLEFVRGASDSFNEKRQCDREIIIAQRKIDYHRKHPNFDPETIRKPLIKMRLDFGV